MIETIRRVHNYARGMRYWVARCASLEGEVSRLLDVVAEQELQLDMWKRKVGHPIVLSSTPALRAWLCDLCEGVHIAPEGSGPWHCDACDGLEMTEAAELVRSWRGVAQRATAAADALEGQT